MWGPCEVQISRVSILRYKFYDRGSHPVTYGIPVEHRTLMAITVDVQYMSELLLLLCYYTIIVIVYKLYGTQSKHGILRSNVK